MAETNIAWTSTQLPDGTLLPGFTFNPWVGCTALSPACDHCYAEALVKRWGGDFATRRRTASANWRKPLGWNRAAAAAGIRRRVFCASLADVFDNKADQAWRSDVWDLIRACPALDWQLLTKRPQNIAKMLPDDWGSGWSNVWLGTTVENQEEAARRIPHLLRVPATVNFLSCEPLLGPVDLAAWIKRLHWVIIGGESGHGARPMHSQWARDLLTQCCSTNVAAFFKQVGKAHPDFWPYVSPGKGDDPAHWPVEFRVQQFPVPA